MSGNTTELLDRWRTVNDRAALDALLATHLHWIRKRVRARLGFHAALRAKLESGDIVQETALELLRYGPRFRISSGEHFRALLARIIENVLRDNRDRVLAKCRVAARERPLPTYSVLDLDPPVAEADRPLDRLTAREAEELLSLALLLIDPDLRGVYVLRQWDDLAFGDVAACFGISEEAARKRHERAVARLTTVMHRIRSCRLDALLTASESGARRS